MRAMVVKHLPEHHGSNGVNVHLVGLEIEVDVVGRRSECGGLLFEVMEQEKYWTPPPDQWLGVCIHEIVPIKK